MVTPSHFASLPPLNTCSFEKVFFGKKKHEASLLIPSLYPEKSLFGWTKAKFEGRPKKEDLKLFPSDLWKFPAKNSSNMFKVCGHNYFPFVLALWSFGVLRARQRARRISKSQKGSHSQTKHQTRKYSDIMESVNCFQSEIREPLHRRKTLFSLNLPGPKNTNGLCTLEIFVLATYFQGKFNFNFQWLFWGGFPISATKGRNLTETEKAQNALKLFHKIWSTSPLVSNI